MSRFISIAALIGVICASPVHAQSLQERAQSIIDGMGAASSTFNTGTMVDTVTPFETASPDEVDLNPSDFDTQEVLIQQSDTMTGRAFSSQVDSFSYRPDIDLGDDPLALADDAVEQSEAVAGGLFSSAGGECSASFEGGEFSGQQFCRRILSRDTRQCYDTRQITVDRRDDWSCGVEGAEYGKKCTKTVNYQCTGVTGGACRKQLITFAGRTPNWSADGTSANIVIPDQDTASCRVKSNTYRIRRNDKAQLTTALLNNLSFNGAGMILIDGKSVITISNSGEVFENAVFLGDEIPLYGMYIKNGHVFGDSRIPPVDIFFFDSFLGECASGRKTRTVNINLLDYFPDRPLARATVSNNQLVRTGGSVTDEIVIKVIRANVVEADVVLRHTFRGPCCSSLSVTDGGSC